MPEIAVLTNGGTLPAPERSSWSDSIVDFVRAVFDISPALPETAKAELTQAGLDPYRKVVTVAGLALLGVLLVVALRK